MAYCSIAEKKIALQKWNVGETSSEKEKNVDFFLDMVIRMSPSLQTNIYSGTVDVDFFFFF